MRKLLTLFLLLGALVAQSQTITEADLLGRWNFIGMGNGGNYIDFENNAVHSENGEQVSEEEKESFFGPGGLKEQVLKSYLIVEPGPYMKVLFAGRDMEEGAFTLVAEDGKQYMERKDNRMLIVLKDGLLYLYPNPEAGTYTTLRKQKD